MRNLINSRAKINKMNKKSRKEKNDLKIQQIPVPFTEQFGFVRVFVCLIFMKTGIWGFASLRHYRIFHMI